MAAGELADLISADTKAAPRGVGLRSLRQPVELEMRNTARFQNPGHLAQVAENNVTGRDVLKNSVRVNQVKMVVLKRGKVGSSCVTGKGVGC